MKTIIFKFLLVGLGSALLTASVFVFISQQPKYQPQVSETANSNDIATTTTLTASTTLINVPTTTITDIKISENKPAVHKENTKPITAIPALTDFRGESTSSTSTVQVVEQPKYDYLAMRAFVDSWYNFSPDIDRAQKTLSLASKAIMAGNYSLAVSYTEDSLKIYDDIITRSREVAIPTNTTPEVKILMQDTIQMHIMYIGKFRTATIAADTFDKKLEAGGMPPTTELEESGKMFNEAYDYGRKVFAPKLFELENTVEKYKPN